MIGRYRALLSAPGFMRVLASSLLGRLPSGMCSLAILLFVHARTGSFMAAGLAVGAFALMGAVTSPLFGGLVDRTGQTRVLVSAAVMQAMLLLSLVLAADAGAPVLAVVALAAAAGATPPPIAGCVRALWQDVVPDPAVLESAYAFDATSQELIWIGGPLLVGAAAAFFSPAAAVVLCALVTLGGTVLFATSPPSRRWRSSAGERSLTRVLANPGLRLLLASALFAGMVIGVVELGLPALAVEHGSRSLAGPLLAAFSVGSMLGGLLYSARSWSLAPGRRYAIMLISMALCVAPLVLVTSVIAAFPLAALAGLGVAPVLACQFSLVGALAPRDATTEAFAWHRAATIGGMSAGAALGGSLLDAHGSGGAFALGAASAALAGVLVLLGCALIDPRAKPVTGFPASRRRIPELPS